MNHKKTVRQLTPLLCGALLALLLLPQIASAQSAKSLRINEVLVINKDNYQDPYGNKGAWIEIYNTSAGTVNLGGCFLTNDPSNPRAYPIPRADVLTAIKPRQHILFWADGMPSRGTFHTSFTLDPNRENTIQLYDADGTTLIDEVTVPAGQEADKSYARVDDGKPEWAQTERVTPSTNNVTIDVNEKLENFKEHDSSGVIVTIVAMLVVFTALILLFFAFKAVGKAAVQSTRRRVQSHGVSEEAATATATIPGEVHAAIAMALYEMQQEVHDYESAVITIDRVRRRYSPWSSKIHTLRQLPHK